MMSPSTPCRSRQARSHPCAFTLIELLVVISIVAVLLAVIMPSFKRAREVAMATQCASNLRQQLVAMTSYSNNERDTALPWTGRWSSGWGIRMTAFLDAPYQAALADPDDNGYFGPFFKKYAIFRCPQNERSTGPEYYNWNYGYNARLAAGVTSGNSGQQLIAWKDRRTLIQIKYNPAKIVMITDLNYNNFLSLAYLTSNTNLVDKPRVHFEEKLNLAFLDGHVKLLAEGQDKTLIHVDGVSQASPTGAPTGW
jgi:prepilin-type N-terminal cleavage/methylation domain-containing protein/prepilin-type processing-associated H-X9-DG protein